jgi:hypothetical protein
MAHTPVTAAPAVVSDLKYVPGKGFKMIPRDKDYKKPGLNWCGAGGGGAAARRVTS